MKEIENKQEDRDGLPPFVKTWPQLYILLTVTLFALITFFYLFMTHFE